jgi:hypothetical protein
VERLLSRFILVAFFYLGMEKDKDLPHSTTEEPRTVNLIMIKD